MEYRNGTRMLKDRKWNVWLQVLLVQPYSPHLFRQGEMPGPTILMDVLRGKTTTAGAKHQWKKALRKTDIKDDGVEAKWLKKMPLPCRNCSDEDDQSTWLPMTHFSFTYTGEAELWETWYVRDKIFSVFGAHAGTGY